jgi:ABC-type transporter Mla MlaB component
MAAHTYPRPVTGRNGTCPAGAGADPTRYDNGVLRITLLPDARIGLAGEIDEDTYPALIGALEELAGQVPEVHLDLAGVLYCDLAGLRAITRLAEGSRARRVVLHGIPPQLHAVLSIVGWDSTPGLVIGS